jgi:hypothetical protein
VRPCLSKKLFIYASEKLFKENIKVRYKKIELYYRNFAGYMGLTGGCFGLYFVRITGGRAFTGIFKSKFDRQTLGAGPL